MNFSQKSKSPKWNLITLGFFIILSFLMLSYSDYGTLQKSSQSIVYIPIIIGIASIIIYALSRLFIKRYNWIVTLLGIATMLMIAIPIFFGAAKHN
ncbi:hypothetical protein [Dokdonia donghaensis]|uniref:Uncharacterized protein n=1 Tax=Dokdonia donghaensis DSW-1 TaxID=1300343 RepID=A0A0A2GQD6_9FLAO|nr:hypothetical protein [Dokdonia donghaensis]ANH61308.1 hypothetical protein I597_2411 [Dokdonia donghaensis DSW-1]KGO05499.1 hypothetical protein NV36_00645 [Dokdonia donghaensis DSW-1]